MNPIIKNQTDVDELTQIDEVEVIDKSELVVYNDDYNTFEWVIKCFMEVCNHTAVQSEQLSLIVHYRGKAVVKSGALEKLKPMKNSLVDRGLSAVIESFQEKQ